jgi:hypothetical protein
VIQPMKHAKATKGRSTDDSTKSTEQGGQKFGQRPDQSNSGAEATSAGVLTLIRAASEANGVVSVAP